MSWKDIKKDSEVLIKILGLQDTLEKHLVDRPESQLLPSVVQWVHRDVILPFWVDRHVTLNQAPHGRSTADLLFILLSYAAGAGGNKLAKMPAEQDAAQVLAALQRLGNLQTSTEEKADKVFLDCAAVVVRQLHHAPSETLETTRGFGLDYGDPQDEYKGDEEEEDKRPIEDLQEVKSEKLARSFLPWCTRVFFEYWHAETLWAKMDTDMEFDKTVIHTARPKLVAWIETHFKYELPRTFDECFAAWIYRVVTPLGSQRMATRTPSATGKKYDPIELFQRDSITTNLELEKWRAETKALALLQTPMAPWAILAGFGSLFDARYGKTSDFKKEHVVLHDELLDRYNQITTPTIGAGRPRRPLIMQFPHNGRWVVQDGKQLKKIDCADVQEALLVWMWLMKARYQSKTGMGLIAIDAWLADFYS